MRWEPAWRRAALLLVSLCLCCGLVTAAGSDHESATTDLLLADGLTAKALLQVRPHSAAPPLSCTLPSLTDVSCVQHHNHPGDLRAAAGAVAVGATAPAAAAAGDAEPSPRTVLGYVTPWNGGGYDFAKRCRCR